MSKTSSAQQIPVKTDSSHLYKNIESYSRRNGFTRFIYRLVFKPVASLSPKKKVQRKGYKKLIQKPYSAFEGKIIRHIIIEPLDPFSFSVTDTSVHPRNFITKAGNSLHIKSRQITIRNLLLFRKHQVFDSLLVKESERLIRSQGYIHDVSFFVKSASTNSDSVDIYIRELDKWSIIPKASFSASRVTIQLNDKNFLGTGHEFKNGYTWYHKTGDDAYQTSYFIPNIRNTYINAGLHYGTDEFRNFSQSLAIDRPFYSPFARWAAGVALSQEFRKDSIPMNDSLLVLQSFKYNILDCWAGGAIQVFKGETENTRTTNFIYAIRFLRTRYLQKPDITVDPLKIYADAIFYLGTTGISTRKYVQDKFIFNFGVTEDVPVGRVFALTGGYLERNHSGRLYAGVRISTGNYYTWGYLSPNLEHGTFFRSSRAEQGVLTAGLVYFTGLLELGKWKVRQFIKPQVSFGMNRLSYDSLTLNDGYGLDGFNSPALSGTSRLLFTLQTQTYAPWNILGFRFGPYLICSLGMLGTAKTGFRNSPMFSHIGFGVLIKNDWLVFNTFQVSVAFYPLIPGSGQNVFKLNSFKTYDIGFRDFEIGKPEPVAFE